MGKVIVDITMSLDGYVTGPNDNRENGLGDDGMVLHEWVFEGRTEADEKLLFEEPMQTLGSCILGRRTPGQAYFRHSQRSVGRQHTLRTLQGVRAHPSPARNVTAWPNDVHLCDGWDGKRPATGQSRCRG